MFKEFKETLISIICSRLFVVIVVLFILFAALVQRLFVLQIVDGEEYLNNFQLKILRERSISSTRGNILDRNGTLLAYDELAYAVTIEDTYESSSDRNSELNSTIRKVVKMIEENGDSVISDFNIVLDKYGNYQYAVTERQLLRFLADIYGHTATKTLKLTERNSTPDDVMELLMERYEIGGYEEKDAEKKNFIPGLGYTKAEALKVVTVRYAMGANSFQRYIATTMASDVSEETVAVIMENSSELQGVNIAEETIRKYTDSKYISHLVGYTGKISQEEYDEYSRQFPDKYTLNDMVGKAGIEYTLETQLQGVKGKQELSVDNLGRIIKVLSETNPVAGNDLYLTIDLELQKAAYNILEQKIAGILLQKIINVKEITGRVTSSTVQIPIDDVYFALINNNVIDISHFMETDAGPTEAAVYQKFIGKQNSVLDALAGEMLTTATPYEQLTTEYQAYESFIVDMLGSETMNVIKKDEVDTTDEVYRQWREQTISLQEYLRHAIAMNWLDITKFQLENQYADTEEVYGELVAFICDSLGSNSGFAKLLYKYMLHDELLTGREVCLILYEQDAITTSDEDRAALEDGSVGAYAFIRERIRNLEITPAQLALDPCTGSVVITDVNTGEIRACVGYPSYDSNRLANTIDAAYYRQLQEDLSNPMWDAATQERTAPGSTFKMVTAVAALEENVVSLSDTTTCVVSGWDTVPPKVNCWINPRGGAHGALNIVGAIQNSCNYFFYEMGYRLSRDEAGVYNEKLGISKIQQYASLFGLNDKSGIEITESESRISTEYPITSSIGQGNHNYTTVALARYVTTVANSGTCYNISLLDRLTDSSGNVLMDYVPQVRNTIDVPDSTWNAVHQGMRNVVENSGTFRGVESPVIAGKTGTAEEQTSRPNHALFVGYAPYDNPELAIACRIANGYTSSNTAEVARDILQYYYKTVEEDQLITGRASMPASSSASLAD